MPAHNTISNIPVLTNAIYSTANQRRLNPYYKETVMCGFGRNLFTAFIDMFADEDNVCVPDWRRVEEQYDCKTIVVNTATIPITGGTITLTAASHLLSGTYDPIQPSFGLLAPATGQLLFVSSMNTSTPNAHTATVIPFGTTSVTLAPNTTLLVVPVNFRLEGACNVGDTSTTVPGIERLYTMGIYSRKFTATGTALASWCKKIQIFQQININNPCELVDCWWHADLENTYNEFIYGLEALRIIGSANTNTANLQVGGEAYRSMTGLVPQLRAKATNVTYNTAAGYKLSDFESTALSIKKKRGYCNEYIGYGGIGWRSSFEADIRTQLPNGAVVYGVFDGLSQYTQDGVAKSPKERAIDFGFSSVAIDGITLHLHDLEAFNDECFLGATGFNYLNSFFYMPACKMLCGGQTGKAIKITYLVNPDCNVDRSYIQRDYGILYPDKTPNDCDKHEWLWLTEQGLEVVCADRWIWGEGV